MRTYSFTGTPRAIGQAFGETCREEIAALYDLRVRNALEQALRFGGQRATVADLLALAERSTTLTRDFDPAGWDELVGIAEGAAMPLVEILAMNGLTDFRDGLAWPESSQADGCTSVLVHGSATRHGRVLAGQTWDLATDNLPHVICVHRAPTDAPQTWTLTTDGCLSLIGLNDAGLAVGTTNIRTTDARAGVNYLSILHAALGCRRFDDALALIERAHRAGAHYYWVASADGRAASVECSARRAFRAELNADDRFAVHANHALNPAVQAIEGAAAGASSLARQRRLETLVAARAGDIGREDLEGFFADTTDGPNAICRDDLDGLNTNGVVVVDPSAGEIRVCHGVPTRNPWLTLREGALA
jgi:isopenicillin-N N-acyltransferase-like protein